MFNLRWLSPKGDVSSLHALALSLTLSAIGVAALTHATHDIGVLDGLASVLDRRVERTKAIGDADCEHAAVPLLSVIAGIVALYQTLGIA